MNSSCMKLAVQPDWRSVELRKALRRFLVVATIMVSCALSFDFLFGGPLSWFVRQRFIIPPIEAKWGFHAERRSHDLWGSAYTITEVTPGGPFDRAGIAPGYVVVPKLQGFMLFPIQDWFYDNLDRAEDELYVRLRRLPNDPRTDTVFHVRIRPAT